MLSRLCKFLSVKCLWRCWILSFLFDEPVLIFVSPCEQKRIHNFFKSRELCIVRTNFHVWHLSSVFYHVIGISFTWFLLFRMCGYSHCFSYYLILQGIIILHSLAHGGMSWWYADMYFCSWSVAFQLQCTFYGIVLQLWLQL